MDYNASSANQANHQQKNDDEIDLLEVLGILLAKWQILFVCGILGIAVGIFIACWSRDVFQSDAMLQLDSKSKSGKAMVDMAALFDSQSPAEAEIRLIKSRHVLMEVVESLDMQYIATPVGFVDRLKRQEGRLDLDLFEISDALNSMDYEWVLEAKDLNSYKLFSPLGGTLVDGLVGETYHAAFGGDTVHICVKSMFARPGQKFKLGKASVLDVAEGLQKQVEVAEDGKNTNIIVLKYENRYADRAADVLNAIVEMYVRQNVEMRSAEAEKTLEFLEAQLPSIKAKKDSSEQLLTNYRNQAGTVDLGAEAKGTLERQVQLKAQLLQLDQQRQENSRLYKDDHPTMVAIMQQQERLRREIGKEEAKTKNLPTTQQEVLKLQQDVEINNTLYSTVLNNIQQLRVVRAGEIGNVRIVDRACVRSKSIKPKRKLILLGGFAGGILFGCGLIFLLRMFSSRGVGSSSEIERVTGVSVYAKIPKSKVDPSLPNAKNPKFILAEADPEDLAIEKVRTLRTALEFSFIDQDGKVLMITGITPGAGKSFVSLNLSFLFAQMNKKVLLVDADLRKSRISERHEKGVSDVLKGEVQLSDAVKQLADGTFFLPIGTKVSNPGELLASKEFIALVDKMKQEYDLVLIDTPPIALVSDAQAIARVADFGLVVLVYKKHTIESIQETLSQLDVAGLDKRAFVLNQCFNDGSSYGYGGYGYGYGYGYGDRYGGKKKSSKKSFIQRLAKKLRNMN